MRPVSRGLLIILLAGVVTAAPASAAVRPTLAIVHSTPSVTVRGTHFRPAEKVRLTLAAGDTRLTRRIVASGRGTFTATVGALPSFDPCSVSYAVQAVGANGERATVKFIARECPPAP
jgi:hypothetical protein